MCLSATPIEQIEIPEPEIVVTPEPTPEPTPAPTPEPTPVEVPEEMEEEVEEWVSLGTFELTAYCSCKKCCGKWAINRPVDENGNEIVYTANGSVAKAGKTIAVDPKVIPYGSKVKIKGHVYTAQDTGVSGKHIDIYFDDHDDALVFGRQRKEVFILKGGNE